MRVKMEEENIIQYLEEKIKDRETILIEIIYNYSLWLKVLTYSKYKPHAKKSQKFQLLFKDVIFRSLELKYPKEIKAEFQRNFEEFVEFDVSYISNILDKIKDSTEYDEFIAKFNQVCFKKLYDYFLQETKERLKNLQEIDKKMINFLFNLVKNAISKNESGGFQDYEFNNEGHMMKVNTKDWAAQFNLVFKEDLRLSVDRFINTFTYGGGILGPNEREQVVNYWEFYDNLLKLGIGYYIPWIQSKGKVFMHFKIFSKIYEDRAQLFAFLEEIPDLDQKIEEGGMLQEKEELKKKWQ